MSMVSVTKRRQRTYFEKVLYKDYEKDNWTPSTSQDYAATVRLYNKYGGERTYEQFLDDILGGSR